MDTPPYTPPLSPISPLQLFHHLAFSPIVPALSDPATALPTQPLLPIQPKPSRSKPRTIILCFDGKGNKFGENSNVVRFFRALVKDKRKEQVVYFQPGLGTYKKSSFLARTMSSIASTIGAVTGSHLDNRVKDGYKFIIQQYHHGDKICLFGFSDGALAARALAGMIHKVGILPKNSAQQVDFAFNVFATTGYHGYKLSQEFKETFSIPGSSSIDFVGAWDSVSSVGSIPRTHPYTAVNYAVKTFRHALALDERQLRLRPGTWSEGTLENEQELDTDIPVPDDPVDTDRDHRDYVPPNRDHADVKEVWFAGCHADVGGRRHERQLNPDPSSMPLFWMIKESILANLGILFDMGYLKSLDFYFGDLLDEVNKRDLKEDLGETYTKIVNYAPISPTQPPTGMPTEQTFLQGQPINLEHCTKQYIHWSIFFQVIFIIYWWIFQIVPALYAYQDSQGNWVRRRTHDLGRGRYIPFYKNEIQVHESVKDWIEMTKDTKNPYTPIAQNWDFVSKSPLLRYVK